MFFFAVLFIGLILLIIWIILTLILTSNIVYYIKKKIPTYIAFPLSAFLILFIASFFTFGCGNLIPYAMQPSYHEFKQMCELNKLPNNEEKYNKILAYFDLSLDSLDWDKLNEKTWKLREDSNLYKKNVFEYEADTDWKQINYRAKMVASFLSNEPIINRYNIKAMEFFIKWQTGRYHLKPKSVARSFELKWREDYLTCYDIVDENLEVLDDKQRND